MAKNMYERQTLGLSMPRIAQSTVPEMMANAVQESAVQNAEKLYNTAERLYETDFEISARRMISDIYSKNPNDPEALRQNFDAAFKGLTKDASPETSMKLAAQFEMLAMPHMARATQNRIDLNTDKLKQNSLTLLNDSLNQLEHTAVDMLSDNPDIAYNASRAAQYNRLTIQQQLDATDEQGNPLFAADQRVRYLNEANQNVMFYGLKRYIDQSPDKIAARQQILEGQKRFKFYDENGQLQAELDPLSQMDMQTFMKLDDYMVREAEAYQNALGVQEKRAEINSFVNGDRLIDPKNNEQRKAIDDYFNQDILPQIETLPFIDRVNEINKFSNQFGVVPEVIKSDIRAKIRNGTPEQKQQSALMINNLLDVNPLLAPEFSDDEISYAKAFLQNSAGNVDPKSVVEMLHKEYDPRNEEILKLRENKLRTEVKFDPIKNARKFFADQAPFKFFGNAVEFPKDASVSQEIALEIDNIYKQEFKKYPDVKAAEEATRARVSKIYGLTFIDGRARITKYPIENQYQIPGVKDQGWIFEQLEENVQKINPQLPIENIIIQADRRTEEEVGAGIPPSYPITYLDENGRISVLKDSNGRMARFRPNTAVMVEQSNAKREQLAKEQFDDNKRQKIKEINQLEARFGIITPEMRESLLDQSNGKRSPSLVNISKVRVTTNSQQIAKAFNNWRAD